MPRAFAIVMAGGSGTRFWPLSRAARPKQLLPLAGGDESLLRATVRRVGQVVALEDVLVVTSEALADAVREDVDLPPANVLAEPEGRNTAPCIGWAATRVAREDPDAVCVVLPSDHHVSDEAAYAETLRRAIDAAANGDIVTVGVRPTRPETGYGYIEMGEELVEGVFDARRFVEKPNRQRAEQLIASGQVLWNSGMFFFQAARMLDAIDTHLPGLGEALGAYRAASLEDEPALIAETYGDLPSVSIDHGVMEKVDGVAVVPADFGWSDLGSFASAWELADKDPQGNVVVAADRGAGQGGGVVNIDASGMYVHAPMDKLVALVGVEDLVIVDTGDVLLVVPRDRAQDVKSLVAALKAHADPRL